MNKKKILLLSLASLLLVSCGTKHLTKEEALLRAETMKEKVENDEVAIPSKYVYTQNHSFTDSMKVSELHERFQMLVDEDNDYYYIEQIKTLIELSPLDEVTKSTVSYGYYLFIQDNQLIYAKTTFLSKEYMVLFEGTSPEDELLASKLDFYKNLFLHEKLLIKESTIKSYDFKDIYDIGTYFENIVQYIVPVEHHDEVVRESLEEASYTSDNDLFVKTNYSASKDDLIYDITRQLSFSNYLVSSYDEKYTYRVSDGFVYNNYSYAYQQNISYDKADLSTFEKVDDIDFYNKNKHILI